MRILPIASALVGLSLALLTSCTSTSVAATAEKAPRKAASKTWTENVGGNLPAEANVALLEEVAHLPKDKHGFPSYPDDQTHRVVRATAYSHMQNEPGAPGRMNAEGGILKYGEVRSAAADWSKYPVGTKFKIKGMPYLYVVDDYGSALTGTNTVDIFHPTLAGMKKWGLRTIEIDVIQWGSWERTLALLKGRRGYWHCADMYAAAERKVKSGAAVAGFSNPGDDTQG
ncbi:3D domain-containing protein [Roseibacillus ishigakijimensis]|uniref:3D domain-containing protein n=1 Tax=Roseibacillus ishigakijimensis TaxID=454146 RepID=A0A934VMR2_9BACT|nr:3D domain-containing protein [Roseibacillus ishigakijimensis]MBK1834542.1 3D domain-containing protein [Roseibacillus ishigakijimensis]